MFETQCGWHKAVAFINGAVHFQVSYNDGLKVCPFVLSFDFSEEVFHRIALPEAKVRAKNEFHIYGFRGSLSLVFNELVDNKRRYSIWVMKEYGIVKSWTELFTVDLSGYIRRVFGFMENGHVLFGKQWRENYESDDTELSSYDPESQQVKKLGIPGWTVHFCTDNYVENLVLLDKPNVVRSRWVVSRKRKFRSPSPQSNQIGAVGLQGVVKELPLADDIDRVESEEERATDKETICELKRAIVEKTSSGVGDVGSP
nr:f-box protein cpr30 [Quercus suber]